MDVKESKGDWKVWLRVINYDNYTFSLWLIPTHLTTGLYKNPISHNKCVKITENI